MSPRTYPLPDYTPALNAIAGQLLGLIRQLPAERQAPILARAFFVLGTILFETEGRYVSDVQIQRWADAAAEDALQT